MLGLWTDVEVGVVDLSGCVDVLSGQRRDQGQRDKRNPDINHDFDHHDHDLDREP